MQIAGLMVVIERPERIAEVAGLLGSARPVSARADSGAMGRERDNTAMAEGASKPQPPIFNLQAYSPAEIKEAVEKVGVKKANLPFLASFMLAIVAGGGVGFGALYFTIVASDASLGFATIRVLGGLVFTLGLALVLVGGAELFTGNNLIVMAWASGKVSTRTMLGNWTVVWFGNLFGALGLILLVFFSHHLDMNEGRIGLTVLSTAAGKIRPDMVTLFFKGILCNVLVCAAVWLAYAGRSVTDKMVAVVLPVSAFIAAGFEHCVANMYFLPLAWLLIQTGHVPTNFDASSITIAGIIHNLVPVTLGNIVGGAGFVGAVYWAIYRAAFGASYRDEK